MTGFEWKAWHVLAALLCGAWGGALFVVLIVGPLREAIRDVSAAVWRLDATVKSLLQERQR